MILMPQIFDITANENARFKHNELELIFIPPLRNPTSIDQGRIIFVLSACLSSTLNFFYIF